MYNSDWYMHSEPSGKESILFFAIPTKFETQSKNIIKNDLIIIYYVVNVFSKIHHLTVSFLIG